MPVKMVEKQLQQNTYTETEAYNIAVERARKHLQQQMPAKSRFLHESIGLVKNARPDLVQAEVIWLVEEPIAEKQQIALPQEVKAVEEEQQP